MKVLLVYDHDDWILGEIARQLARALSQEIQAALIATDLVDFPRQFLRLQKSHAVVHLLTPWALYDWHELIFRPCVVNLWHTVDWRRFDRTIQRADFLYVGSEQWQSEARAHIPADLPLARMQYGLDTNLFTRDQSARRRYLESHGLPADTILFGFAGKATSNEANRKGLDLLWNCMCKLKFETDIGFRLRMIGREWGEDMIPGELRDEADLEPFLPQESLPVYYSSLDYYLCTSRVEGVPYPVIEAMSCACTVLSTPVGIVPEIIRHGVNGYLLGEDRIEQDFIRIIRETAVDQRKREQIGEQARDTIVARLNWDHVVEPGVFLVNYEAAIRHYNQVPAAERQYSRRKAIRLLARHTLGRMRAKVRLRSRVKALWAEKS